MQRACLIVNPFAGKGRSFAQYQTALAQLFAAHDYAVEVKTTTAVPHSARELAALATQTCDLVVACGGDGTVHGVLQGMAHTNASLGVLPFGTANALARNIGLPLDPVAALTKLLSFKVKQVPLCLAETASETRWFAVMAGAGPDGRLVHEMSLTTKMGVGRNAYYLEAARLFLTRRFHPFQVEYRRLNSQVWTTCEAVAMMASRIPDLGGLFGGLTKASSLHHPHLLVRLLAAPAHFSFPAWLAYSRAGRSGSNPWLATHEVEELRCLGKHEDTLAQVDGEPMGPIPLTIRIVPGSLNLRMP